ncbi:E3 ubiquitin-protein ligase DTX3L isoform X1 [Esox lucius]|nr:E3 ubiquitin-protein ligase DTX3L isoform X1 [Esox lucius]
MSDEEPMDYSTSSAEGHTSANEYSSVHFSQVSPTVFAASGAQQHYAVFANVQESDCTNLDSPCGGPAGTTGDKQPKRDQHSPDLYPAEPSAPPDETTVYVCVKLTGEPPLNWKSTLQKNLQSWLNKEFVKKGGVTINILSVDGNWATVNITPSSALEDLLKENEIQIALKNSLTTVTVQFHRNAPSSTNSNQPSTRKIQMTINATFDISDYSNEVQSALKTKFSHLCLHEQSLTITGSFDEVEQFHNEVTKVIKEAEAGPADTRLKEIICPLPLIHFSYVNQAYRKEIEQIEQINGVKINAEVMVSIEDDPQKTNRDSQLTNASREFIDFFQMHVGDFDNISMPMTHVDKGDFMNMLMNVENDKAKLVLNVSANGCEVFGQKQHMVAVRKAFGKWPMGHVSFDKTSGMDQSSTEKASGSSARPETPQMIGSDIKDPLLSDGLTMNEAHWLLMKLAFDEKITAIKRKFGVDFITEMSPGKVKVKTRPTKGVISLESHAIRALMHLYQKAASSAMSCCLLDSTQAKNVKKVLAEIHPQHHCVLEGEPTGPFRLVGLPEHLSRAVREIEKRLGVSVFKAEDKQRIEYPKDDSFTPILQQPENTGMGGATGGAEEENCPICMDVFKDKQTLTCKHGFCKDCLRQAVESMGSICPLCKDVFGMVEGNQPHGKMTHCTIKTSLPGFPGCGTIIITYSIPDGRQTNKHPNPGQVFIGARRIAYLPDNKEGNEVLSLLKKAFDQKLIFTVGMSRTTGAENSVTWNDIHHKTNTHGGPQNFGYPDPKYLSRVKDELKAKGIK